jgi:hypothetical protein
VTRRIEAHQAVESALAQLSDARLRDELSLVSTTTTTGARTLVKTVAGRPVFVKRIALSKIELDHPMSTANLFQLPMIYQYGIDSRGFGAWRELAANIMTTEWVLAGDSANFPLLHHYRVLPADRAPAPMDQAGLDAYVT